MIQEIQRIRPNFGENDLLLHDRSAELSFLPTEFVPHTVTAFLAGNMVCTFEFEYQIDEDAKSEQMISMDVKLIAGKYTSKVLKLIIDFNSLTDLINKTIIAAQCLQVKKQLLTKDSHKRNYDLASSILQDAVEQFRLDSELKKLIRE